ncbi:superoxide dismutase [Campylobacter sp. MIT 99-7217]|uniref:superoxide dismutase family protein n=1 Tax=Campylobacter sp. MIT 99-7217 TaxID=535091 RepID=UPI0011580CA9|nr:superoxide dismutase family protein [Campylobacter sp. MIT 99-7217]TQR31308.1 superoxide dismutase [Campylobacter sp. MIT 99-7217]
MKIRSKILVSALVAACLSSSVIADEDNTKLYDPKSEANHLVIPMQMLGEKKNTPIGEVVAVQTEHGVVFYPNLKDIPAGIHGFHVHEKADCGKTKQGLGLKAGGHWDPDKTNAHSYPWSANGHKGDLPALYADAQGVANTPVLAPKIKTLDELKKHALMVHVGGDNFHDHPAALGGGGARFACGVIK